MRQLTHRGSPPQAHDGGSVLTSRPARSRWIALTVAMVWRREMLRFLRSRSRILSLLAGPLLFLFVFGWGLSPALSRPDDPAAGFRLFLLPGVIVMAMLFVGVHNAVGIVLDRQMGFLREMLVAPVPAWALLLGKALGSMCIATSQGVIVLAVGIASGSRPALTSVAVALVLMALIGLVVAWFGICIACRMKNMAAFQAVMSLIINPLFFCSAALYPPNGPHGLLAVLTRANPLSYAVDALRRVLQPAGTAAGIRFGSVTVPLATEVIGIAILTAGLLMLASALFRRNR